METLIVIGIGIGVEIEIDGAAEDMTVVTRMRMKGEADEGEDLDPIPKVQVRIHRVVLVTGLEPEIVIVIVIMVEILNEDIVMMKIVMMMMVVVDDEAAAEAPDGNEIRVVYVRHLHREEIVTEIEKEIEIPNRIRDEEGGMMTIKIVTMMILILPMQIHRYEHQIEVGI